MSMGDLVPRNYTAFRGVDFRGEEINITRSPDALNMWKDYRKTESIRTRPELELLEEFDTPVWGIFYYEVGTQQMLIVHSGTKLYKLKGGSRTEIYEGLAPRRSASFIYNNMFYFKDGINYLEYDGETISEVVGYIPTTSIARRPAGSGTTYEDVNMLSPYRKNTFLADGEAVEYYLDAQDIDSAYTPIVLVNNVQTQDFTWNSTEGKITFKEAPPAPLTDGQDNITVTFRKTVDDHRKRINYCTLLQVFDNRVFFAGHPDYPNTVWYSSLNDPTYCSDLDYINEGLDLANITGLVAGSNELWVFKEPSQANTTVFYHTPTTDSAYGKIYPSAHSNISTGCIAGATNFNDDIIFFSDRGMEAVNGGVTTERVLAHRSTLIDSKLLTEANYTDMCVAEWEGYLLVFIDNKVYLADSRATLTNENHTEYEWFYWELAKNVTCTRVYDGILYVGTEDGIYALTDNEAAVYSYWTTPIDKFKHPQYLKTTNKKGCITEALGDITLSVKTDNTDWEEISTHENVTDCFVARVRKKKFKDIQLKFSTETRFVLESAVLESFIGGYIKR
ncbi:MAG: hypothetical protein IJV71_12170 [Lachnospiraceae bacterium]|nr:hypothetical protein [Lachnospiraceae bacterium]